jgi:hypothetical protein
MMQHDLEKIYTKKLWDILTTDQVEWQPNHPGRRITPTVTLYQEAIPSTFGLSVKGRKKQETNPRDKVLPDQSNKIRFSGHDPGLLGNSLRIVLLTSEQDRAVHR